STFHGNSQCRISIVNNTICITRHIRRRCSLFKYTNICSKKLAVPFPNTMHIWHTNSNLLNTANNFCHDFYLLSELANISKYQKFKSLESHPLKIIGFCEKQLSLSPTNKTIHLF